MTGAGVRDSQAAESFRLTVPASWFELPLHPTTRDAAIRFLVEQRVRDVPELREHRTELAQLLRRQARDAWDSGAVYCACFAMIAEGLLIPGAVTVSVIPRPPGARSMLDALVEALPSRESSGDGEPFSMRSIVEIEGVGRVARSQGISDVELPGGAGRVRSLIMQTRASRLRTARRRGDVRARGRGGDHPRPPRVRRAPRAAADLSTA